MPQDRQAESYQDAQWGPDVSGLPLTDAPVSFKRLQIVMNSAGFYLTRVEPGKSVIHWHQEPGDRVITTLMPDFRAKDHAEAVYELAYVLDLLPKLTGSGSPDDGHRLIATLRSLSNDPY